MHTDTLSHARKQNDVHAHSYTIMNHLHLVTPQTYTRTHIHTKAHTQATPTTPGWWTTSAYPSLRPCPWRGCWLPHGCTATMSSCLPLCHPLLKSVVTRLFFCLYGPLTSHQPGTSSYSLHKGLIKWHDVIFHSCWSYPQGSHDNVLLFYYENVNDYILKHTCMHTAW